MNHIEDLVSGLVANPPSSSPSPPTSSSASETLATAKANNHHGKLSAMSKDVCMQCWSVCGASFFAPSLPLPDYLP